MWIGRKLLGLLVLLPFLAINGLGMWLMEWDREALEEAGSGTPSTLLRLAQGASLTHEDVYRPAKLSEGDRVAQVRVCVGDDRYTEPFCDCLVNAIEDRTSGMQFQLAMVAIQRNSGEASLTKLPELGPYSRAAAAHGMGLEDFKSEVLATRDAVKSSRQQCERKS